MSRLLTLAHAGLWIVATLIAFPLYVAFYAAVSVWGWLFFED